MNTWILAWDVHKIMEFDFTGLFDANIFYPYKNTLAYSEHMLGSAIFALPIIVFFKNSILAYNIIFLMGFSLSGFGMYLLAYYLTGNRLASFCAGIIFAFFPWRFGQLGHLQSQVAQWLPLTFLYLHKFIESRSYKHLLLLASFFVLQFLSNGYYGLYLSLFMGLFIVKEAYNHGLSDKEFLYKLGLFFFISAIFILPSYYPYIKVKYEMGFTRSFKELIMFSADILSYLSAPPTNYLWGDITKIFLKPEGELFLGLTAILLSITGIIRFKREMEYSNYAKKSYDKTKSLKILSRWISSLLIIIIIVSAVIWFAGGFDFTVAGIRIRAARINRPLTIALVLGFIRLLMEQRFRVHLNSLYHAISGSKEGFYFIVLILSFLFSLGPIIYLNSIEIFFGPYYLLYMFFPGFSGLRVPARFVIMVALAVSVFAAFGVARILGRFEGNLKKFGITAILSILILFESSSIPIPTPPIAVGKEIPDVYKWLANEKGDFAILELPLPKKAEEIVWIETKRLYYSTYHWKKLVNGYSGYFSPAYDFLYLEGMKGFPKNSSIGFIKELDIKYLIIHSAEYSQTKWEAIKSDLQNHEYILKLFKQFGTDYVYEVVGNYATMSDPHPRDIRELSRDGWSIKASGGEPKLAIDGNIKTRWITGYPQQPGDFLEIDLGGIRIVSKILMELGTDFLDFPRGYKIEFSKDGQAWETVKAEDSATPLLYSFINHHRSVEFAISFPPVNGRFVKITQIGSNPENYWSIREIRLFE